MAGRLGLLAPAAVTATIGGTNGKGSSATLAAGIWQASGYRVGRYLSPHLLRYNERIAIDGPRPMTRRSAQLSPRSRRRAASCL